MSYDVDDTVAAGGEGRAANEEVVDKTEMEGEGERNNANAVISEGHNDRATNTKALQMLKTTKRSYIFSVYSSSYRSQSQLWYHWGGPHQLQRNVSSPRETSSLLLI